MTDTPQTVAHALDAWLFYRSKLRELSLVAPSTLANQKAIVRVLSQGLGEHRLEGLRKSHIELWMGARLHSGARSPVTVRGEMNVLRQALNWCVDEGFLTAKPRFPTLSVPATEDALPSDAAFLWVLANVPAHHAGALEFMMLTGLSPHELERVQERDVVWPDDKHPHGVVTLGIGQRDDFPVKQASRRRWVPLNGRALDLWYNLATGRPQSATVFPTVAAMQKAIRRCVNSDPRWAPSAVPAGALDITPKLMRKWFASRVAGDHPEHVLQRLMGHAPGSPITRRHYVRSSDEQMATAVVGVDSPIRGIGR